MESVSCAVQKFPNIRYLSIFHTRYQAPKFSYFKYCPNLEVFRFQHNSQKPLDSSECSQFSHLKKLIEIDLKSTRVNPKAMFVLIQSLPLTLRRFRHRQPTAVVHLDAFIERFPSLEKFRVNNSEANARAWVRVLTVACCYVSMPHHITADTPSPPRSWWSVVCWCGAGLGRHTTPPRHRTTTPHSHHTATPQPHNHRVVW